MIGIFDLWLVYKDKTTISQRIHEKFNRWIDALIMVSLLATTWWIWGPGGFVPVMLGVIIGHLFWYADRVPGDKK